MWTAEHDAAFTALKSALVRELILKLPDLNKRFILQTDASDKAVGAVLMQEHDDQKFPVAYASKKLLPREKNYSVIERECLAIVWGIEKFNRYLFGVEFDLETDHKPLAYLNTAKTLNPRLLRWALRLQPYRFRIVAVKGEHNVGPDFLSRTTMKMQ